MLNDKKALLVAGRRGRGKTVIDHFDEAARNVRLLVHHGDALTYPTDALVLKFAQSRYGLDARVAHKLATAVDPVPSPQPGEMELVESKGFIAARQVLFVGVPKLRDFGYAEVRDFARRALSGLADRASDAKTVTFTVHGAKFGLDENESFDSQLAGILEGLESGGAPQALETIAFVELDEARAARLQDRLTAHLPNGRFSRTVKTKRSSTEAWRSAGIDSASKPRLFVAMPFAKEMDDTFHYGIQGASNLAGYLCERADLTVYTGDVLEWVKVRIASADLVVADLTSANPNVYLEVGFAWGCNVPTVLVVRDTVDLKFDVRGQRCLVYGSIKELEEKLHLELSGIAARLR